METLTFKRAADMSFFKNTEFLVIASAPNDEFCTQAGVNYNDNIIECNALKNLMIRTYGQPPQNCEFFILENHHDFGTYLELAIFYNEEDEQSEEYALQCELTPDNWDEEALNELESAGYTPHQTKIIKLTA